MNDKVSKNESKSESPNELSNKMSESENKSLNELSDEVNESEMRVINKSKTKDENALKDKDDAFDNRNFHGLGLTRKEVDGEIVETIEPTRGAKLNEMEVMKSIENYYKDLD